MDVGLGPLVTGARVWLVRHGEAAETLEPRHLTPNGRAQVARLAAWCAAHGVAPHVIRHSRLARAEETAAILAAHLKPAGGCFAVDGVTPHDDAASYAHVLRAESEPVLLVTHMPFVSDLAEDLTRRRDHVPFGTGEIVGLEPADPAWRIVATFRP